MFTAEIEGLIIDRYKKRRASDSDTVQMLVRLDSAAKSMELLAYFLMLLV